MNKELTYNWYALYTRSRNEKKVYAQLLEQEIEAFLPLETKIRQWSDRKKKVEEPMIRSYVFVKASEKEYYDVLNVFGAVRYVTFNGKAASIPEWQIDAMRKMIEYKEDHYFTGEYFKKGDIVEITEGPLCGYEGEIVHDSKGAKKVIIRINDIGYAMVVESPVSIVESKNLE